MTSKRLTPSDFTLRSDLPHPTWEAVHGFQTIWLSEKPKLNREFFQTMGYHEKLHPHVSINLKSLVITINPKSKHEYKIELQRINSPAQLLDFTLQILSKNWCDPSLIYEFLHTIEHACRSIFNNNSQGVFCPFGHPMKIDWKKKTSTKLFPTKKSPHDSKN